MQYTKHLETTVVEKIGTMRKACDKFLEKCHPVLKPSSGSGRSTCECWGHVGVGMFWIRFGKVLDFVGAVKGMEAQAFTRYYYEVASKSH